MLGSRLLELTGFASAHRALRVFFIVTTMVSVALGLSEVTSVGLIGIPLALVLVFAWHHALTMLRSGLGGSWPLRTGWGLFYAALTFWVLILSYAFWWNTLGAARPPGALEAHLEQELGELEQVHHAMSIARARVEALASQASQLARTETVAGGACSNAMTGQGPAFTLLSDRAERYAAIAQRLRLEVQENGGTFADIRATPQGAPDRIARLRLRIVQRASDLAGDGQSLIDDAVQFRTGQPLADPVRNSQLACVNQPLAAALQEAGEALRSVPAALQAGAPVGASDDRALDRLLQLAGLETMREGSRDRSRELLALAMALMLELGVVLLSLNGGPPSRRAGLDAEPLPPPDDRTLPPPAGDDRA